MITMIKLYRYEVGVIDRKEMTFTVMSKHLFIHRAIKEFAKQQSHDLNLAEISGNELREWAISSATTGNILPLEEMLKVGAVSIGD